MWQDTAVAVCQLAMVPSMIPTIIGDDKPALTTSAMNAIIMTAIAFVQATLGLWLGAATVTLIIAMWTILATQTILSQRSHHRSPPPAWTSLRDGNPRAVRDVGAEPGRRHRSAR